MYNFFSNETILYKVVWSEDEHLFAMWMNRIQNESHFVHYYIFDNKAEVIEVSERKIKSFSAHIYIL